MSEASKKNTEQDQAIHEYLQSLLSEVAEDEESFAEAEAAKVELTPVIKAEVSRPHEEPEKSPSVVGLDQLVAEVPDVLTQTVAEIKTDVQPEIKTETEVELQLEPEEEVPESGVPEWAESRFQCLLFNVSGLKMAVPLVKLNSVIPWDENITETPNQTDWYLGLVQHLQNQVKVIDTALLVMPENRHKVLENNSENRLGHILLVDDYKWGLACTSIGDVIWLDKDEVKWRKNKSTRAWLSGTSLEHLCAIMDTEVFAKMLTKTD
ncbi:MAG: hypothetical protein DIZ80_13595 [endosymbiont of Galathealinum brachiosum]|uniref:CheW-like domain-containing protein n=1 Tax=endosymbiont of Galathealinum brachiosum TaxID=2200906 RepID=A0A370D8A2_9GAMM|nr:MAG: hypothetical protein DIZ80_13595 [endosymbiont of Galathealinum brachiosum]